jgi:hypothetical protein
MQLPDPSVELERALAELVEARQRLEAAEDELEAAREGAHLALRRLGAFLVHEGVAVPHELLRRLYWAYPDLHVEVMAKAFGLQNNEVGCYAGSRGPAGAVSAVRHAGDPYLPVAQRGPARSWWAAASIQRLAAVPAVPGGA